MSNCKLWNWSCGKGLLIGFLELIENVCINSINTIIRITIEGIYMTIRRIPKRSMSSVTSEGHAQESGIRYIS